MTGSPKPVPSPQPLSRIVRSTLRDRPATAPVPSRAAARGFQAKLDVPVLPLATAWGLIWRYWLILHGDLGGYTASAACHTGSLPCRAAQGGEPTPKRGRRDPSRYTPTGSSRLAADTSTLGMIATGDSTPDPYLRPSTTAWANRSAGISSDSWTPSPNHGNADWTRKPDGSTPPRPTWDRPSKPRTSGRSRPA
jgi:hypothetical protein